MSLRYGYGTNGFTSHRLEDALAVLAGLGYDGVALTLDHLHLDPFAPDLPARTAALRRRLDDLGLAVVVETGARYLLDPWHKHQPTLVSDGDRDPRLDYLHRAVEVAADLGAEAMSFWSGVLPAGVDRATGWQRLTDGVGRVLELAERREVTLAFEPEPGMFVDTLDGVLDLRSRLSDPERLRVTLDLGHIVCNEPRDVATTIRLAGDLIANVQVDDMVRGTHEHLPLGTGEVDLATAVGTLDEIGYRGLAALELPRQAHAAPVVARESLTFLRSAEREHQIRVDATRIRTHFPAAAREVGRSTGSTTDPGEIRIEDVTRGRMLDALALALDDTSALSEEVHALYRFGDADERRAVLRSLHRLDLGDSAADLVHDGLRTNDPRLVAAALGPYGATVLDPPAWRQGVLKCLFTGVPLDLVSGYPDRTDAELVRMVADYADERRAAGRSVPPDARDLLDQSTTDPSRET